ncbi:molybdopterin-dependent oxidoreductase [Bacteroidota bacterium]
MKSFNTACPRNCYSTCSMKVVVDEGRLNLIEGDSSNKATPEGVCLKGLSYVERVHSNDRLLYPLKKNLKSGSFQRISWQEALDIISEKLISLKENYGPQSVLYYSASGTKGILNRVGTDFWKMYGGYTTTYGDLCWPAGLEATRLTLGENKHNSPWDIQNSKCIIMWGKNPAETNIHQTAHIDEALKTGAKLIVIDPRRTQSSERASLLIQPRPGTDGALALGVANLLIKNKRIDDDFIDKHVLGYKEYKSALEEYSTDTVSRITDVPEKFILRLTEETGTTNPVTINAGFGMQRYTNSGQTIRAIISLLALTGNIGKPGAGWIYANLQSHIFDETLDPIAFYPPDKPDGIARVSISTALLGKQMLETNNPLLKMIWVERGNPVTQNPDTNTVLKAIRELDFRVVVDQFLTDTAQEADIVLPAKSMFEQSDVIGAYWHSYIQLKQKMIEPPGEIKPESEIYRLLGDRLKFPKKFLLENFPVTDEEVNKYLNKHLLPFPELSLETLKQNPVLAPGTEEVVFKDYKFKTPSGKIELFSEEAKSRWNVNPLPDYNEPVEFVKSKGKYPLYFMTPNTKNRIHSQFNNLDLIKQFDSTPELSIHPTDAKERGVKNEDIVKVFNDRGELNIKVKLDIGIKQGCISATNGWWISQGGTVNFLSQGKETDMGYGAAFHDNLVEVEKIT